MPPSSTTREKERTISDVLILEFNGVTTNQHDAVNRILGIDPITGVGDWPAGLLHHIGAGGAAGNSVVMEVWDSQESQMTFVSSRLGPALDKAGISDPTPVEWLSFVGEYHNS
jgi:hypothetical protein